MNTLKTGILMAALTALLVLLGRWIGGDSGMMTAFVFALALNFFSYWFSDKIALAMANAQPVEPGEAPELYALVQRLSERAGMPMPRLYISPDESPNAFATGRDPQHAAVVVNRGLMRILNEPQVAGVLAHELSHVKHRDTLISTIAATMAGALMMLSRWGQFAMMFGGYGGRDDDDRGGNPLVMLIMLIVAPIAAMLIQLAISRSREYAADEAGGRLTGHPLDLANALLRLEQGTEMVPGNVNPATAHMYIVNPLRGGSGLSALFSTHPPTAERVTRLEALDRQLHSHPA